MPVVDLHKRAFTDETITKLEIFEKYFEAWLPVFIHHRSYNEVNILDFFAGQGQDINGVPGSPLRILKIIKIYQNGIIRKNLRINVCLNEYNKKKFNSLNALIGSFKNELSGLEKNLFIEYYNRDFKKLFDEKKNELKSSVNLIFLDQNGIKQVSSEVFSTLDSFLITDFIFFISSSFFKRFGKDFTSHFPSLDQKRISTSNYVEIHRVILDEYKKQLPPSSKTVLYPFSIKKCSNIYGLIFGSKHPLAVDKFLRIVWDKNKLNGEANFDIDEDLKKQQRNLFENKLTKIEEFQSDLKEFILADNRTNKDIYDFTIENGHIPKHSIGLIKKLKKEKKISYYGQPRINYSNCYKNKNIITFKII